MATNLLTIIKKTGKELTFEEVHLINSYRKKFFNSSTLITPAPKNDDWNKLYFLLYNQKQKLVAFARIHEVTILFMKKRYDIFGTATLIAIETGKGYGAMIKTAMKEYSEAMGKTSIGFCNPKLSGYYAKLGLGIIPGGAERFYQITDEGTHKQFLAGDVLYSAGKDKLIEEILKHPKEKILSYRYHW